MRRVPQKDELLRLYYDEEMTMQEMATHYQAGRNTVRKWFRHRGILVAPRGKGKEQPDDDTLYRLYIDNDMHLIDLAKLLGVGQTTLSTWLREADITKYGAVERRRQKEAI